MENENNTDLAHWYVVYTYSGYENKVKVTLEKLVENRGMQDKIQEIIIPMEEEIEIKDGKQKTSIKKVFPGYVLIKMIMTDETWYIVKNIKGVFNFVGVGEKPLPLTEKEMQTLGITITLQQLKKSLKIKKELKLKFLCLVEKQQLILNLIKYKKYK